MAEIRGKLRKADYTFFAPDGKTELGKVSKKWAGAMKELFTSADTYGVQVAAAAGDERTKMLVLGAAVAIDCLMSTQGGAKAGGESDDE